MSTASVTSVKDELKIDTWQKMKQGSESMCRKIRLATSGYGVSV